MSSGGGGASVGAGTGFTGGFGPGVNEGGVSVGVVAAVDCPPESDRRPGSSRLGAQAPASIEINTSAAILYLRVTMPPPKANGVPLLPGRRPGALHGQIPGKTEDGKASCPNILHLWD